MPLSLINKKIIISGGASGIGWSTAKICLSRGAIVYICDIDSNSLKKVQKHPLNKKKLLFQLELQELVGQLQKFVFQEVLLFIFVISIANL